MTDFVGSELSFGDLILKEGFDYRGKWWLSFLVIPQAHLEDLFGIHGTIQPFDAYKKEPKFWEEISQLTRDSYIKFLDTQAHDLNGRLRRQWFQWKDFDRLEAALRLFKSGGTNQPIRLSIVARDPVH